MNAELIFTICNMTAMVAWLIIIIAPQWKYTSKIIQTGIIPILLGTVYLYIIATSYGSIDGGFGSLQEVGLLFQNPVLLLAGWIHYLAFDLWVGSWELGDAIKNNVPRILLIPCLVLTFFFGPIGLLLYLLVRSMRTKKFLAHDNF